MADIFISYSSNDREVALDLVDRLRATGHDVWIDGSEILGALNWSSEIVEAINGCSTLIFLISSNSAKSHNCAKEVLLASEKQKSILPVVLEDVQLPVIFEYPLAGLQRVRFEAFDQIGTALSKLRGGRSALDAMTTMSSAPVVPDDGRIRLAVLPFDDLSPTHDNDWFADGMTDELISTLGALKQIRVNPRNDVIYYKGKQTQLTEIAHDLRVRYVVSGSVQKSGERIRIRVSLSDALMHSLVWSEKYDGTFEDVFDLQDKTCFAIAQALKLSLAPSDERRIEERPTENVEAYELLLKAVEYGRYFTKEGLERAMRCYEEAIRLDPRFISAIAQLAQLYINYHSYYAQEDETLLSKTHALLARLKELGAKDKLLWLNATLHLRLGNVELAREEIEQAIASNAEDSKLYNLAAIIYSELGLVDKTVEAFKQTLHFNENDRFAYSNYIGALENAGYHDQVAEPAQRAIAIFERHLRLFPDDPATNATFVSILRSAGRHEEALILADRLVAENKLDGILLSDILAFYMVEKHYHKALQVIRKLRELGFTPIEQYLERTEFDIIRGMPGFEADAAPQS